MKYTRDLQVKGRYDVIVIGGGTAGVMAAVAAHRENAKVLIIEQFGGLGGSASMSLVMPLMSIYIKGKTGHSRLSNELSERMRALGGMNGNDHYFDPLLLQKALEDMTIGCDVLYHTTLVDCVVENGEISAIIVANKDGLSVYQAKCYIDATGDADVAYKAGVECRSGNPKDGTNQPVSLRFEMAGIDMEAVKTQLLEHGIDFSGYFDMNFPFISNLLQQAYKENILTEQDIEYVQAFPIPGRNDAMSFNCPELAPSVRVNSIENLSRYQREGKSAVIRMRNFFKKYIRGFENSYITSIAPMVGIRESRRINARYVMHVEDVLTYRKFEDAIVSTNYPLDVHGENEEAEGLSEAYEKMLPETEKYWQIPFRVMIAENISNLLVAGRSAGFDFLTQSAARIQLICRAMGEAAGVCAGYLVKEDKVNFHVMNLSEVMPRVQNVLEK